jgi:hypothetical protein
MWYTSIMQNSVMFKEKPAYIFICKFDCTSDFFQKNQLQVRLELKIWINYNLKKFRTLQNYGTNVSWVTVNRELVNIFHVANTPPRVTDTRPASTSVVSSQLDHNLNHHPLMVVRLSLKLEAAYRLQKSSPQHCKGQSDSKSQRSKQRSRSSPGCCHPPLA